VVPRLMGTFDGQWLDTSVELPEGRWRNALTDSPVTGGQMTELSACFPVAFLLKEGKE
jgi:hypothetical protein